MKHVQGRFARMGAASLLASSLFFSLTACGATKGTTEDVVAEVTQSESADTSDELVSSGEGTQSTGESVTTVVNASTSGVIDTTELFTDRDLTQVADTSGATAITVQSGEDVQITEEGVYVISGEATDVTITVEAADDAKVQLVLDGVSITNTDSPAIYVKSADKVFVTTVEGTTNTLQVTGTFVADGETNTDAAIFSRSDVVLNGLGTLTISSTDNGISCKDDIKVCGGTYVIEATSDGLEANDSIRIADGNLTITAGKDALHAENDEDDTTGYVYICGGTLNITAGDDGIQATTYLQVDGGTFTISAVEALESTYVQVNGGDFNLSASDDGINATTKSASIGTPTIEITGGTLAITMGAGDTDAIDANGNLIVSGGQIDISAQSAFDIDGTITYTGGTVTVNGEQVTEITNSMMMGGGMGGEMGGMPGNGGPGGGMGPGGDTGSQGGMGETTQG